MNLNLRIPMHIVHLFKMNIGTILSYISRVGGSIPLVWSYFAEFQCKERRGRMLSALATFWMIGNITVAGIGKTSCWSHIYKKQGEEKQNF